MSNPEVHLSELSPEGERERRRAEGHFGGHAGQAIPSYDPVSGLIYYRDKESGEVHESSNVHDVRVMCEMQPARFELMPRPKPAAAMDPHRVDDEHVAIP